MKSVHTPTVLLGTLLLSVPFLLHKYVILTVLIAFLGAQLLYFGLVGHKDIFYALYSKHLSRAKKLGISRQKLYIKCVDAFQDLSTWDKYLFTYSASSSRTKNYFWIVLITISITAINIPIPEIPIHDYEIIREVKETLPVPIGCLNEKPINVAVTIGKKLFQSDYVDYQVIYGADCSCGYCKSSRLYYGESEDNFSTLYIYNELKDITVVLDKETGFIERIQQSVISMDGIRDEILYERNSETEGINQSLDNIILY